MHKLAVKLDNIERRKRTTGVLHLAAGCFLLIKGWDYFRLYGMEARWVLLLVLAAAALSIAYGFLKKSWDPDARYNQWMRLLQVTTFALLAIQFFPVGQSFEIILLFAWSIGCLLLLFTERKVFQDAEMVFNKEGIFIPGYFTNRRLFWNGITDVVVRPDYLTIFKADNSFLQYEVLKNLNTSALDEIALYCKQQIQLATKAS